VKNDLNGYNLHAAALQTRLTKLRKPTRPVSLAPTHSLVMPPQHSTAPNTNTNTDITSTLEELRRFIPKSSLTSLPVTTDLEHALSTRPGFLPVRIHIGVFSSHAPRHADCSAWLYFTTPSHGTEGAPPILVYVHDEMHNKWAAGAVNLAAELKWIELDREFWACENAKDVRTMARWYLLVLNCEARVQNIDAGAVPWSRGFAEDVYRMCRMFGMKKLEMDRLKTFKAPKAARRESSSDSEADVRVSAKLRPKRQEQTASRTRVDVSSARLRVGTSEPSDEQGITTPNVPSPEMVFTDTTDSDSGNSCRISDDPMVNNERRLNLTDAIEKHHNVLMDIRSGKACLESMTREDKKHGNGSREVFAARKILLEMMEIRAKASEDAIKIFQEQRKWC
jgi:hypothetical protein